MNIPITTTRPVSPALSVIPQFLSAMTPTLVPLGSSNILVPPQAIYQLAFNLARQQLDRERAEIAFRQHHRLFNN